MASFVDALNLFLIVIFFFGFSRHGSFSNDLKLKIVVGHFLHFSIIVLYYGWLVLLSNHFLRRNLQNFFLLHVKILCFWLTCRRISHKTHHHNHGRVENNESWHPVCFFFVALFQPTWRLQDEVFVYTVYVIVQVEENLYKFGQTDSFL